MFRGRICFDDPYSDVSKEGVPDYLPTEQALSFARHDRWEEPFGSKEESVQGAESVDCAYEYLLRQNRAPAPSNRFAEAVKVRCAFWSIYSLVYPILLFSCVSFLHLDHSTDSA